MLSTGFHLCRYGSRGKRTGQSVLVSKVNTSVGAHLKTFWSIFVYIVFVSFVNNVNIITVEDFHIRSLYILCNPLLQNIVQVKCLTLYE